MIWREIRAILNSELDSTERKAIFLAALGSMLEYYDFIIFGLMAIYVSHQFLHYQQIHNLVSTIIFGIFFFGYLFRPAGMIVYINLYNRGTNTTYLNNLTIGLLFAATIAISLTPEKPLALGIMFLIVSRVLQGFTRGAEAQSEFGYLLRNLGEKRSIAVYGILAGAEIGVLLAIITNNILNHVYLPNQMNLFGWRIPFIIGGILCILIFLLRRLLRIKKFHQTYQPMTPFYKIFVHYRLQIIFATLFSGIRATLTWLLLLLIPLFLSHKFHNNYRYIGNLMLMTSISSIIGSFFVLRFTKIIHAKKILPPTLIINLFALWFFEISLNYNLAIETSLIILGLVSGVITVLALRIINGFFPSSIRLSAVTLCYNFGHTLISGGILFIILLITEIIHLLLIPQIEFNSLFLQITVIIFSILTITVLVLSRYIRHLTNYKYNNLFTK